MKKRNLLVILSLFFALAIFAQIENPVQWSFEQKKVSEEEAELIFKANIDSTWHLYAMDLPEDGPISTEIVFEIVKGVSLVESVSQHESNALITHYDASFDIQLSWYERQAIFLQKIKINNSEDYHLSGFVRYMCCDDESCLPPTKLAFSFQSEQSSVLGKSDDTTTVAAILPQENEAELQLDESQLNDYWTPVIDELKAFDKNTSSAGDISLWFIFLAGFVGGLLALFTPCVWPIIPMTVSFFLKRNKNKQKGRREAVIYGFSIVFIYVFLGILITLIFGASALNELSTNAAFNLVFFALLVVFAISFFGYFDITLPASWSTSLNNKAENTTGFLSILLMAAVLVVVSFSCTGPIIGTLLVEVSTSGSLLAPTIGMLGFSLALSVPFTLFALFPSWLNSAPRSGSWLNTVKVFLAFLELALALKFLSVADLTKNWGILPRELFIAIWILLAIALGLYMFGIIRFPHDSKKDKIGWGRRLIAILSFLSAIYLSTGYFGNPLKAVSAFLPPMENTAVFHDYERGMSYAAENNMPVFLDFTGYGCVNCRKMEAAVFTHAEVEAQMEQFVIITLYVDDRTELSEPIKVFENGKSFKLETIGEKWSYLQRHKFGANAQPYYILLDNAGKPISSPYAYDESIEGFVDFLRQGLERYDR